MVQQTLARQDAERTNQFLYAASQGDVAKIRQVSPSRSLETQCLIVRDYKCRDHQQSMYAVSQGDIAKNLLEQPHRSPQT